MVSKNTLWRRIRSSIKVIIFAMFMYTVFGVLSPLITSVLDTNQKPQSEVQIQKIDPTSGHWLKTEEDNLTNQEDKPVQVPKAKINQEDLKLSQKELVDVPQAAPEPQQQEPEVEVSHNNKELSNTDVIFYWTEGPKLKAVTIMSLNENSKRGGVVALPLYTKVEDEGRVTTLAEVFVNKGRKSVTGLLEKKLEIKVESYVDIDQNTFEKLSEMLGPVDISGEVLTVAEAFEQTRIGQRKDDTAVVRAVAGRIIRPDMLIKIPKMVWVLSREIDTNLGPSEIMTIYRITQNTQVDTMTKVALPGENYVENGKKYRDVSEQVWKNILWELTR